MTEAWQVRWNELVAELNADASSRDPEFVAVSGDGAGGEVVVYRSATTGDELAAWYTARVRQAGFGEPMFHQVPVSMDMWHAATQAVSDASAALTELGIIVWRMEPKGIGQTIVASYEDPHGHGIPQFLLHDLARFPPGTIEFRRVDGPTQVGA